MGSFQRRLAGQAVDDLQGTWAGITNGIAGIDGELYITNNITEDRQFFRAYLDE